MRLLRRLNEIACLAIAVLTLGATSSRSDAWAPVVVKATDIERYDPAADRTGDKASVRAPVEMPAASRKQAVSRKTSKPTPTSLSVESRSNSIPETTGALPVVPAGSVRAEPPLPDDPQLAAGSPHETAKPKAKAAAAEEPPLPPRRREKISVTERFCESIGDAAANAQLARQRAELAEAETKVLGNIATLEAKTAEFKSWLEKRETFRRRAQDDVVKIYAKMPPDSAAAQLIAMPEEIAAAIVSKFDPKVASKIMSEMDATKAARLSTVMAGAADIVTAGKKAQP